MCAFYRWAGGLWLWQARREGLAGWRAAGRSGLQACRRFRRHGRGAMDGTLGSVGCPAMGAGFSTATDHHLQPAAKVLPAAVALLVGTCLRLPARSLPKNNLDPAAPGEHALMPSRPDARTPARPHALRHHHRHHRRLTFASVLVPRYDRVTRVRRPASLPPAGQTSISPALPEPRPLRSHHSAGSRPPIPRVDVHACRPITDRHIYTTNVHSEDLILPLIKVVSGPGTWQHHPRHPA